MKEAVLGYVGVMICVFTVLFFAAICHGAWEDYQRHKKRIEDEVWKRLND